MATNSAKSAGKSSAERVRKALKTAADPRASSLEKIRVASKELTELGREAVKQYRNLDDDTRKKVIAGLAGTTALIAAVLGVAARRPGRGGRNAKSGTDRSR